MLRIGIGYDIHRLVKGRKLFLGGVLIPFAKGLAGHSDADVLLHAICDALLGAMAEADIGEYFPDNDTRYKDIDSRILLENVVALVKRKGYVIKNIDTIIIAQKPKLSQYKQKIRKSIADIINIGKEDIGLKAKTNEGLGELGSSKAIAAYAVALLSRKSKEK